MLQPYAEGSFKINFELGLNQKSKKGNLFLEQAPLDKYIATYIKYISQNFADDKEIFKSDTAEFSDKMKELETILSDVYEKALINKPENFTSILKEDIIKSVGKFEKITEQVGENFDSVSILNVLQSDETPLAYIDKTFSDNFQSNVEEIEIAKKGVTVDDNFMDYKIYIFHLNTDTRTGNAFIKNSESDECIS